MRQFYYVLILLDEDVRLDSISSTSFASIVDEAQFSLREYLDDYGTFYDLPERAMDSGFATIHKFEIGARSEGEIIWTYPFDGEVTLEEAMLPLLTHEDYISEQKEDEKYDVNESINNQQSFCIAKGVPNFAPIDGHCYSCKDNIYLPQPKRGISTIKAASEHITGCPHCFKTFLD
jgi:hypothetical protein